jgi:hypothetical protein
MRVLDQGSRTLPGLAAKLVGAQPTIRQWETATTEPPLGNYQAAAAQGELRRQEEPSGRAGGRERAEGGRPDAGVSESRRVRSGRQQRQQSGIRSMQREEARTGQLVERSATSNLEGGKSRLY